MIQIQRARINFNHFLIGSTKVRSGRLFAFLMLKYTCNQIQFSPCTFVQERSLYCNCCTTQSIIHAYYNTGKEETNIITIRNYMENLSNNITIGKVQCRHKNLLSMIIASIQLSLLHCSCSAHTTTTQHPRTHCITLTKRFYNKLQCHNTSILIYSNI